MSKVCRVGVPAGLNHITNGDINEILSLALHIADLNEGVRPLLSLRDELDQGYVHPRTDRTMRLRSEYAELIQKWALELNQPQTAITARLIAKYYNPENVTGFKETEDIEQVEEVLSLVSRFESLGYHVTLTRVAR